MRAPQRQRVRSAGRVGPLLVIALLSAIALVGIAGRFTATPAPDISSRRTLVADLTITPVPTSTATPSPAPIQGVQLTSPRSGVLWLRTGVIRVRGLVTNGATDLRGEVTIGAESIGDASFKVSPDGTFHADIPIVPPEARHRAEFRLYQAGSPDRLMSSTTLFVERGESVLIWSPADADVPVVGDQLRVSGPVSDTVGSVRIRLQDSAGGTIAEITRPTTMGTPADGLAATASFSVDLALSPDHPRGTAWLFVFGLDAATGEVIDRADTRVSLGG